MERKCYFNNYKLNSIRINSRTYQTVIIDLYLTEHITKETAESLLSYTIPDELALPSDYSVWADSDYASNLMRKCYINNYMLNRCRYDRQDFEAMFIDLINLELVSADYQTDILGYEIPEYLNLVNTIKHKQCYLTNYALEGVRKTNRDYQMIMIYLALLGVIEKSEAEGLLGYRVTDYLELPFDVNNIPDIDPNDPDDPDDHDYPDDPDDHDYPDDPDNP